MLLLTEEAGRSACIKKRNQLCCGDRKLHSYFVINQWGSSFLMRRLTLSEFKQKDPFSTLNDVWVIYCGVILLTHFSLSLNYTCILTCAFLFSCICMRAWCVHTCVQCWCVTYVHIFWKPEKDVKCPVLFFSLPCFFVSYWFWRWTSGEQAPTIFLP